MAEMEQASDPGLTTLTLKETRERAVGRQRRTFVAELVLRGESPARTKHQGRREDLVGRKDSIEIEGWSLIRETEAIEGTGETEEKAVEAEGNAEEAAMKDKGSEALERTKGHGGDLLKLWRTGITYVTSKHDQQRQG